MTYRVHTSYNVHGALLDFDGAEPGTTNEESENLRRRPRSPNIDIILTLVSKTE